MFKEDFECLKYVLDHGTLNGSSIRLAIMARMGLFITLILSLIIVWRI